MVSLMCILEIILLFVCVSSFAIRYESVVDELREEAQHDDSLQLLDIGGGTVAPNLFAPAQGTRLV
jgi:hypothetical protein